VLPALGGKRRPALLKNRPLKKNNSPGSFNQFQLVQVKESKKAFAFDNKGKFLCVHIPFHF